MPTLKETKNRISSVQSTLKITSAMKLVASAKLRRAQSVIEGMWPYERQIYSILGDLLAMEGVSMGNWAEDRTVKNVRILAFASNSSLCGAFNANVIKLALETARSFGDAEVKITSIGRKMADAMRKAGFTSDADYTHLAEKPSYRDAAALAQEVMDDFIAGRCDRVVLVYTHFVSAGKQVPVAETLLPVNPSRMSGEGKVEGVEYIVEPTPQEVLEDLVPKALRLAVYTALLDSNASEHAARTVAMQAATDNGEDLLADLTLQYNKSRQQKITAEILDLAGGVQE